MRLMRWTEPVIAHHTPTHPNTTCCSGGSSSFLCVCSHFVLPWGLFPSSPLWILSTSQGVSASFLKCFHWNGRVSFSFINKTCQGVGWTWKGEEKPLWSAKPRLCMSNMELGANVPSRLMSKGPRPAKASGMKSRKDLIDLEYVGIRELHLPELYLREFPETTITLMDPWVWWACSPSTETSALQESLRFTQLQVLWKAHCKDTFPTPSFAPSLFCLPHTL